jgi:hypothetical protein
MTADSEPRRDRWNKIVVPTAVALEGFFWRLAWFAVLMLLLFSGTCRTRSTPQGEHHEQRSTHPAR